MAGQPPSTAEVWRSPERLRALRRDVEEVEISTRAHTQLLLERGDVGPGQRVLDVACGPGEPTLTAAERVGPTGHVTGIDIAEGALGLARERAKAKQRSNVEFRVARAEELPFRDETFDRYLCRFGAMFFEDLGRAAGEARRVLRPGGRVALMVWGPREQPYFEATIGLLLRYLGLSELPPEKSVPFRFAEAGPLEEALSTAGFRDVAAETLTVPWVWQGTPEDVRDHWRSGLVFFRPLVDALPESVRDRFWQQVAQRFADYREGNLVRVPEVVRIVTGRR